MKVVSKSVMKIANELMNKVSNSLYSCCPIYLINSIDGSTLDGIIEISSDVSTSTIVHEQLADRIVLKYKNGAEIKIPLDMHCYRYKVFTKQELTDLILKPNRKSNNDVFDFEQCLQTQVNADPLRLVEAIDSLVESNVDTVFNADLIDKLISSLFLNDTMLDALFEKLAHSIALSDHRNVLAKKLGEQLTDEQMKSFINAMTAK